jgi:hypothetical protein
MRQIDVTSTNLAKFAIIRIGRADTRRSPILIDPPLLELTGW